MKTLIVYSSKYGCTADCAKYLSTKSSGETTLADINKATNPVEPDSYDTIIIGGSVYIGKVSKKLREFCESNLHTLTGKRIGIFLCCAQPEQANEFLTANFPPTLLDKAITTSVFGSEIRLENMSFFDKTIIKAVTKGGFSKYKTSTENMDEFVQKMGMN